MRNICVACIFHGTNGLRATIADIGRSIPLLQDDPEYRGLSTNIEEAGGRTGMVGGRRNGKSLVNAAISLSILCYRLNIAWKRHNIIRNKSLVAMIPD